MPLDYYKFLESYSIFSVPLKAPNAQCTGKACISNLGSKSLIGSMHTSKKLSTEFELNPISGSKTSYSFKSRGKNTFFLVIKLKYPVIPIKGILSPKHY